MDYADGRGARAGINNKTERQTKKRKLIRQKSQSLRTVSSIATRVPQPSRFPTPIFHHQASTPHRSPIPYRNRPSLAILASPVTSALRPFRYPPLVQLRRNSRTHLPRPFSRGSAKVIHPHRIGVPPPRRSLDSVGHLPPSCIIVQHRIARNIGTSFSAR